jgi:hypothetical protein
MIDMWKVANLVLPGILVEKRSRRIPFQGESYFFKKRRDGIDLKESDLRKSYCTFLQDLEMRLKV